MQNKKKRIYKLSFLTILLLCGGWYTFSQLRAFSPNKIQSEFHLTSKNQTVLTEPEKEAVFEALDQHYFYLGKGVQCYAFVSQDGQTVLKVFKHYHMWPNDSLLKKIHLPAFLDNLKQTILHKRDTRIRYIYESCQLAFDSYRNQTGLLYAHLDKRPFFNKKIILHDRLGFAHSFDLDSIAFVLQKKAHLVFPTLEQLMRRHDISGAQSAIDSLMELIVQRCKKGIANQDAMIVRNFGFIGKNAVEIDVGSFRKDPFLCQPSAYRKELFFEVEQLKTWIKKNHPELVTYIDQQLHSYLNNEF